MESNRARSLHSYMQMKAAIAKADGPDRQDAPVGEIELPLVGSHAALGAKVSPAEAATVSASKKFFPVGAKSSPDFRLPE